MKVYLNNGLLEAEEARISVFDHGFLYGDGIFETLRVYDGVVFQLKEHLKRLRRSAALLFLNIPYGDKEIERIVYETVKANCLKESYVRIMVSRGEGPIGLDTDLCERSTFLIIVNPFKPYPQEYYNEGIKLITARTRRNLKEALSPEIKSLNFLNNILAKRESKQAGALDAIMLNSKGHITECTVANIFFYKNNLLCTPSTTCGILEGITRNLVIDTGRKMGIETEEGEYYIEDLVSAEELFITNTTMEVMPVSYVDNVKFKVGNVSKQLREEYGKIIETA